MDKMPQIVHFDVECKACKGHGTMVEEGVKYHDRKTCITCGGTGKITLKIPKVNWKSQCPHCNEIIALGHYLKEAMEMLQGHSKDNTHWKNENMKITIDANNTRFVETKYHNQDRIELYGTYFEKQRLGNYHGYWDKKEVEEIVEYLQYWLKRKGET